MTNSRSGKLHSPVPRLQTKLHLPTMASMVERSRLLMLLNTITRYKLVLVSAPAGFGKTTLAANWLAQQPETTVPLRYAWLSLDEQDNDLLRFLFYLTAACQRIDSHIGRGLPTMLAAPEPVDVEAMLTMLLNELAAIGEDAPGEHNILVLDDYHLVDNPQIDEALTFLLDYLPASLHLMLLSRMDPPLPLARLRAKRHLLEIRERDLRFSDDEARLFFTDVMQLPLPQPDIASLQARTEGWIAGLHLAGLAIQSADTDFVAQFNGTHRYILDYLTDEVFQHQPPDVQHFLLETSLLNRMCAELCDAVRQSGDSRGMLEKLERASLFVVPLDAQRCWYRYHHLFADLLRQRLRQSMPDEMAVLHERASRWYIASATESEDSGAVDEAIYHALAARDLSRVADILEQFGNGIWERGEHDRLRRWLALLPEDMLRTHPALNIFRGWLAFTGGHYDAAESSLALAEQALDDPDAHAELRGRIAAVWAYIATFRGYPADTVRFAEEALKHLAQQSTWRSSAAIALGDAHSLSGNTRTAEAAYQEALRSSQAAGNVYLMLNAGFKLAAIERQRGRLRLAYDLCSQHIAVAEQSGLVQTAMAGCLIALRGDILCEWNQVAEGLAQTRQAMEAGNRTHHTGFAGWIQLYRARSLLAARDFAGADELLHGMEILTGTLPPWIASPVMAMRVLLWLVRGEMAKALAWANDSGFAAAETEFAGREFEYLAYARLMAAQGKLDSALTALERLLHTARESQRDTLSLVILLTCALLFQAQKRHDDAVDAMTKALTIGENGGFVRSFLDMGAPMLPLLKAAERREITPNYTRRILALMAAPAQPPATDALSERELEILRLIASGLKNQEIADALVISLNTVLYHTKNIYSKLNVTHRTQAVVRARELNLL